MLKFFLETPCHDENISILLEKHCLFFFSRQASQCQNTSMTEGERHNRVFWMISGWIINMVIDAMVLSVIVEIHHSMPCFLQPNWLRTMDLFTNRIGVLCENRIKNTFKLFSCFPLRTTCCDMALFGICTKNHSASALFRSELSWVVVNCFGVATLHKNTSAWVLDVAPFFLRIFHLIKQILYASLDLWETPLFATALHKQEKRFLCYMWQPCCIVLYFGVWPTNEPCKLFSISQAGDSHGPTRCLCRTPRMWSLHPVEHCPRNLVW